MRKVIHVFKTLRIDWSNHIIGFVSTILGIVIAFQMQEYYELRNEKVKSEEAIGLLKIELKENLLRLDQTIKLLHEFSMYGKAILKFESSGPKLRLICKPSQLDSLKKIHPKVDAIKIRDLNDNTGRVEYNYKPKLDFILPTLHDEFWQVLKSSDVFNSIPPKQTAEFIGAYEILNRNFFVDTQVDDFIKYARTPDFRFSNLLKIGEDIEFTSRFRRDLLK